MENQEEKMSSSLDMEKLLNESWRTTNLPEIIKKQKDAEKFIGTTRSKDVIPKLENTFRALNDMKSVSDCKVVIFGQGMFECNCVIIYFNNDYHHYRSISERRKCNWCCFL